MGANANPSGQKKPPDQVRRRNTSLITNLPPAGREGPAPKWPLQVKPTAHETARWKQLWVTPQAVIWEQWHLELVVARYVMFSVQAEERDCPTTLLAEARRMEIELGLTPKAVLALQWTLADPKPNLAPVEDLDKRLAAAKAKAG